MPTYWYTIALFFFVVPEGQDHSLAPNLQIVRGTMEIGDEHYPFQLDANGIVCPVEVVADSNSPGEPLVIRIFRPTKSG